MTVALVMFKSLHLGLCSTLFIELQSDNLRIIYMCVCVCVLLKVLLKKKTK